MCWIQTQSAKRAGNSLSGLCDCTSIGANIAESSCAFSQRESLAKMYIAFKECNETLYWLRLLYDADYLTEKEYESVKADCEELHKMLASITKTTREKLE